MFVVELISRVTGLLQLKYITLINDISIRTKFQKNILILAKKFVLQDIIINNGGDIIECFEKYLKI